MFSTLFLSLILSFSLAVAKNKLLYFGSGAEPKDKSTTIFDQSFGDIIDFAQANKWDAEYFSTPDHYENMDIAKEKRIGTKPFTTENIKQRFEQLEKQIESGEFKSGDQLFIVLNTHGEVKDNYTVGTTDGMIEPEIYLKKITSLAEKKGIKVGVAGLTCYSGRLQTLSDNTNTCVISLSGPNQVGYTTDTDSIAKSLKYSSNLEEVYTTGRLFSSVTPAQPEISTPAGIKTKATLNSIKHHFKTPYDIESGWNQLISCPTADADIKKLLDDLKKMHDATLFSDATNKGLTEDIKKLNTAIKAYEELLASAQKAKEKYDLAFPICVTVPTAEDSRKLEKACVYNVEEMQKLQLYSLHAFLDAKKNDPPETSTAWQVALETLDNVAKELKKNGEPFSKHIYLRPLTYAAIKVGKYEREIYDKLYNIFSKESAKQPNPCRDFKLKN